MGQLSGLCVLFAHIFEAELLVIQEGIVFVESCVVEEFSRWDSKGLGDGLDYIGGGVLAPLLDVTKVALGDARFVGKSLKGEVLVGPEPADGQSYVVGESSLGHSLTPGFESCSAAVRTDRTFRSVWGGMRECNSDSVRRETWAVRSYT